MRENIEPFEHRVIDDRDRLWLRGTQGERKVVEADEVQIIMDAIAEGWDIGIYYADIQGDLDISTIAKSLKQTEDRKWIIKGDVSIENTIFFGRVVFVTAQFNRRANFDLSQFNGDLLFSAARIVGVAIFSRAEFKKEALFDYAQFNGLLTEFPYACFGGDADFRHSQFGGDASFWSAQFKGRAKFGNARFLGDANFKSAQFSEIAQFSRTKFTDDPGLGEALFGGLSTAVFDVGVAYKRAGIYGASHFFEKAGEGFYSGVNYEKATESFRNAKVEYEKEGEYDKAGEMYVREMDSTRDQLRSQIILGKGDVPKAAMFVKLYVLNFWKITSSYGESPLRFIACVLSVILLFALIYSPLLKWWPPKCWESWALIEFKDYPYAGGNGFLTALYFSVVTFATLGFGDITPVSNFGKVMVMIEVLSGYVMFGILITLVARKMTRS